MASLIPSAIAIMSSNCVSTKRQTANAGLSKLHGLRHAYAQRRYEELTGWKAPAAGGPVSKVLSPGQKVMDRQARRTISQELGHSREQISQCVLLER